MRLAVCGHKRIRGAGAWSVHVASAALDPPQLKQSRRSVLARDVHGE